MIRKTKEYDKFVFRKDNRERIDQAHVKRLMESITARNMLEFRPMLVNEDYEVIDGQHRLLAAKALNIDIYYQVQKNLCADEILLMNVVKTWSMADYLNYYCKNDYKEYIKLQKFLKEYSINLKIALNMLMGSSKNKYFEFRKGLFINNDEFVENDIEICWETVNYIKKMNGFSAYTSSGRFWKAMIKMIRHPSFHKEKWKNNLQKMVERFGPKARTEDYLMLFMDVYNYRNTEKINLIHHEII